MAAPYKKERVRSLDEEIGLQIASARAGVGMDQTELADITGITSQMISRYENGHQSIPAAKLYLIAQAIGCSMDFFFAREHLRWATGEDEER